MARQSEGEVRAALVAALAENPRQLGTVYKLDPEMKMKAKNIVELEGAANEGAVGNIRCAIRAILDGIIPNSPSVSNQVIGSLNGMMRDNLDFSPEVKGHLNEVLLELQDRASSKIFKEEELEVRRHGSEEMIRLVEKRGGVYAYSLPHYLNFPCKEDPERYWYKVGFTTGNFDSRILGSHRTTGLPEDPVVRRTYFSASLDPRAMEKKFHKMLKASGLQTDARYGGKEWFATTEEQLDALAELLDFEVQRPNEVAE